MLYQFYRDYPTQALKNCTPDANPVCTTSEAQPMICSANQLTGFYMMGTLIIKGLKFTNLQMQGFIQAKKTQSSKNFLLKHMQIGWLRTCIQNKLACYVSSILSYYWCKNPKIFQGLCPWTPTGAPPWIRCEAYLPCRASLWSFFTKYKVRKLNLLSKTDFRKIAWINPWNACIH